MPTKKKKTLKKNETKSALLENTCFDLISAYNKNKKDHICKNIFQKKWNEINGIELNKLIFFRYTTEQVCSHYKVSIHKFLDKLRRSENTSMSYKKINGKNTV